MATTRGGGQRGERGAETLEFLGLLPIFIAVLLIAWQGLILLRQQSEAADDARVIARAAAICSTGAAPPALVQVDPGARGAPPALVDTSQADWVSVTVVLPPHSVLGNFDLAQAGFPPPRATVTMRHEPC